MKWVDFDKLEQDRLGRGVLFRFPAKRPFEEAVEFMLFHTPWSECGYGMICLSGYHSGMIEILFPAEARYLPKPGEEKSRFVCTKWLRKNWRKWVYAPTPVGKVKVCVRGRPKPVLPGSVR